MSEKTPKSIYQYAVKVIQGKINVNNRVKPIGPGLYFSSVNIHNPWRKDVKYAVKFAISGPNGKSSTISNFQCHKLGPDAVTEYNSLGFQTLLLPSLFPTFLEGFFVIESEEQLDVVGVYTGASDREQHLETMHMERVPHRIVPRSQDLKMDISTGVADWQITSVPSGSTLVTGTAPILTTPFDGWALPTGSAKWIGTLKSTKEGDYTYELKFWLCWPFERAQMAFDLWADNQATISFNGLPTTPAITHLGDAFKPANVTHVVIPTSSFQIGMNLLRIVVHNKGSVSGMLLQGTLMSTTGTGAVGGE